CRTISKADVAVVDSSTFPSPCPSPPALWRDCVGACVRWHARGRSPFPASATVEGRQFNGAPSRGEREPGASRGASSHGFTKKRGCHVSANGLAKRPAHKAV